MNRVSPAVMPIYKLKEEGQQDSGIVAKQEKDPKATEVVTLKEQLSQQEKEISDLKKKLESSANAGPQDTAEKDTQI